MKIYRIENSDGIGPYHSSTVGNNNGRLIQIKTLLNQISEDKNPGPRMEIMGILSKYYDYEFSDSMYDIFRYGFLVDGKSLFCFKSIELLKEWFCHKKYDVNILAELLNNGFNIVEYEIGNNSMIIDLATQSLLLHSNLKNVKRNIITVDHKYDLIYAKSKRIKYTPLIRKEIADKIVKVLTKLNKRNNITGKCCND